MSEARAVYFVLFPQPSHARIHYDGLYKGFCTRDIDGDYSILPRYGVGHLVITAYYAKIDLCLKPKQKGAQEYRAGWDTFLRKEELTGDHRCNIDCLLREEVSASDDPQGGVFFAFSAGVLIPTLVSEGRARDAFETEAQPQLSPDAMRENEKYVAHLQWHKCRSRWKLPASTYSEKVLELARSAASKSRWVVDDRQGGQRPEAEQGNSHGDGEAGPESQSPQEKPRQEQALQEQIQQEELRQEQARQENNTHQHNNDSTDGRLEDSEEGDTDDDSDEDSCGTMDDGTQYDYEIEGGGGRVREGGSGEGVRMVGPYFDNDEDED